MARAYFEATGELILNPRNVEERSLLFADMDWYHELLRYMSEFDYQVDVVRREKGVI